MVVRSRTERGPVPVTLLSGFLGSGKTTLMKRILEQTYSLAGERKKKVAVLVNDMAEVNIDANLVRGTKFLQKEEKMIELHNGCICCTLREDLIKALADLASDEARFDAILVESTGVSNPQEVAETFNVKVGGQGQQLNAPEDWEMQSILKALRGKSSLNELARLDTCVTMVDCVNFQENLATSAEAQDKWKGSADEGDQRNVAPLLMSQIEFADVILLSKCDLCTEEEVTSVKASLKALNPAAVVKKAHRGEVPLADVLDTKLFSVQKAMSSAGWLQNLRGVPMVPETVEYGIKSFVYKSRTPFHPERLFNFLNDYFTLRIQQYITADGKDASPKVPVIDTTDGAVVDATGAGGASNNSNGNDCAAVDTTTTAADAIETEKKNGEDDASSNGKKKEEATTGAVTVATTKDAAADAKDEKMKKYEEDKQKWEDMKKLVEEANKEKQVRMKEKFGNVLRSKGYMWLAGRDHVIGEWSQAGAVGEVSCGGFWFGSLPLEYWPPMNSPPFKMIMKDFDGPVLQDRRQEIVLIGQNLNEEALRKALDDCLIKKEDLKSIKHVILGKKHEWKIGINYLKDPFPAWTEEIEGDTTEEVTVEELVEGTPVEEGKEAEAYAKAAAEAATTTTSGRSQ